MNSLKQLIHSYVSDVWSGQRLDLLPAYMSPECRLTDLYGEKAIFGLDAIRQSIADWIALMDSVDVDVVHAIDNGSEIAWQWTLKGNWSPQPPKAARTSWPSSEDLVLAGITFSFVENNLIVRERTQADLRGLIEQLGYKL